MKKTFRAVLEPDNRNLGWTVVRLPFDATKTWKQRKGMRVTGTINGVAFRTSLFPNKLKGQMLLVNKQLQKAAKVTLGSTVEVVLQPDLEERPEAKIAPELAKLFKSSKALKKFYDELSPSARKDIERYTTEPKSAETRLKRAEQLAERILLTIEGERELPPLLQMVFRRYPHAMEGWKAMTPTQRRGHLMGVFYYQSPESREKRAIKAAEDAVLHAAKKTT